MTRRRPTAITRFAPLLAMLALLSLVAVACGSSAPALTDPKDILTKGISSLQSVKSFHMDLAVAGSVKLNLTGSSAGGGAPFPLDGTAITGDVDVTGKKLSMSVSAPALMGLKADLLLVDNAMYIKAPLFLQTDKWVKQPVTDSATSTVSDPQKTIDALKTFLSQPGVSPAKQPDEKVGDVDCYKVTFTVPSSMITGAIGAAASQLPSGVTIGDLPISVWVSKADQRLTKLSVDLALGNMGTVSLALTLSKYDQPVTLSAPPADQVQAGTGG